MAGGDQCRAVSGRGGAGCNASEGVESRNIQHCMKGDAMVSRHSLYQGPSPWHALRWKLSELGRSAALLRMIVL